jgi:biotin carboxyl carrier protein
LLSGCSQSEDGKKTKQAGAPASHLKSEKDSEDEKKPIDVVASKIEKQEIFDPREFGGRLKSKNQSPLIAVRPGLISHCYKTVGEPVKKGQAIIAVSPVGGVGFKPTIIRAPLAGVISQLSHQKGDLVEKGQRIGVVSESDGFETTVYVTQADLSSLDKQKTVDVELVSAGQTDTGGVESKTKVVQAKVLSKALQPDPDSTGYAVRLGLECSQDQCSDIRLGSFVKMILKENLRQGFRLPLNVLQKNQTQVLLVDREQKARWQAIELGSTFGDSVEISTGLDEPFAKGWLVVTGRSKKPKEGDELNVTTKEDSLKKAIDSPISKSTKAEQNTKPQKG